MSTDQIAFIIENCHACKFEALPYGMAIKWQLHEGDNWQQIEVEHNIYGILERKHFDIISKWIFNEDES